MSNKQVQINSTSWVILVLATTPFALIFLYAPDTQTSTAAAVEWWTAMASGLVAGIAGVSQAFCFFRKKRRPSTINIVAWIGAVVAFGVTAYWTGVSIYLEIVCPHSLLFC